MRCDRRRDGTRLARRWAAPLLGLVVATVARAAEPAGELEVPAAQRHRYDEARAKAAAFEHQARRLSPVVPATPSPLPLDAVFYGLALRLDPAAHTIAGRLRLDARIGSVALASAGLDLDPAMHVDSVRVDGSVASFSHTADDLVVDFGTTRAPSAPVAIEIVYGGTPGPGSGLHFDTHSGMPLIWTLSEPFGARTWWPCQDSPADKADSVDVEITVPDGLAAVSPGILAGTSSSAGWTTHRWRERYPIAPYLVSIAVHPYTVLETSYTPLAGGSMPVTFWSWADQAGLAPPILSLVPQVLTQFATLFGEYPFVAEKYDMAQVNFGGGMEHQTATSLCCWSQLLAVHETAHQWFGDKVTCRSFSDIWLNEGFATYSEALWAEHTSGPAAYAADIWDNRYYGDGTIRVPPGTTSFGRIFDVNLSYNKPSWVLHMLRGILGDAVYFDCVRAYLADPRFAYGTATTEDLRSVCETVSGRDLGNFFQRWIDTAYFPTYLQDWSATPEGGGWQVNLSIEQIQTQGLYRMPIQVRVTTDGGDADFTVEDSLAMQSFILHTAATPRGVRLDPNRRILCTQEAALHGPRFWRGVLVVNEVAWSVGSELTSAYADSVFSGGYPFAFWDLFDAPPGGYVPQLPPPRGHGAVPPAVLGDYSTVIWVGESNLDLWNDASIVAYLRAGGNVLWLGRRGKEALHPSRASRLGVRWAEGPNATLASASAVHPAFVSMAATGAQTGASVFETSFDLPETVLLLAENTSFGVPRGLAAWRHPPQGGTLRASGAHWACIAGRPYRWEHAALRSNVRSVLRTLFQEPIVPSESLPPPFVTRLLDPVPNPFNPTVRVRFELGHPDRVRLRVHTADGRLVRTLLDAPRGAGPDSVLWDGRDDRGDACASGVYVVRFAAGDVVRSTKLTLVR